MKKYLSVLVLIAALLAVAACTSSKDDIKILTENYPPLSFFENGEATGFGSDVVKAIQAELGSKHPIQILSWDEAYSTALKEANVVLFTMDRTPEREAKFHFIGPLGSNVASFYANSAKLLNPADLEEAKSYRAIASTTNWFTEQYLIEQGFKNLVSEADPLQTIHLLADQKADLAVFTDLTLPDLCREAGVELATFSPVLELLSTDYYIAISKDTNTRIVNKWQKAFETIKNTGELARLRSKWFDQ